MRFTASSATKRTVQRAAPWGGSLQTIAMIRCLSEGASTSADPDGHHDRAPPRGAHRRRDRPGGAILLGTNDLTQTTWGLSRHDAGMFLPSYLERNITDADPFQVLDLAGVGKLIAMAVDLGRKTRQDLKLGIGEPNAIHFCEAQRMNYVSCSPFRVPIARLAAAQAALSERGTMDRTRATVRSWAYAKGDSGIGHRE